MECKETDVDLEKVTADPDQKAHWRKIFEDETVAKEELEALKKHEKRIFKMLEKAKEDLERLEAEWPGKLMAFATGKKDRKTLVEHRTRAREIQGLIQDCQDALTELKTKITWGSRGIFQKANLARDRIWELQQAPMNGG